MKITTAALLFSLVAQVQDSAAHTTLQRKRSSQGDDKESLLQEISDEKFSADDHALWERILQDMGMSIAPPTGTIALVQLLE